MTANSLSESLSPAVSVASDPDKTIRVDTRLTEAIEAGTLPNDLLVAGPAGTGKTFGVLTILHLLACDEPGLRILVCRAFRSSITESLLVTFEQEILPADSMEGVAGNAARRYRQSYAYPNGSEIVLGGLDNPERIKSTAWDVIFVNEATELKPEAWDILSSRLNRPGRDPRFGWLIADCNPADPYHWLKKRCDAGRTTLWETSHEANPRLHDGHDWTEDGVAYLARLDSLKGSSYQRLRLGLWAGGEGAWFAGFDPQRDVHASAEYQPGAGKVHLAIDNNGSHIGAVWFQIRDGEHGPHVCVFGDYYSDDKRRHAELHAKAILDRSQQLCGHRVDRITADPSGGQHTGVNTTAQAEYDRVGLPCIPWPKHSGSVLAGLQLIESLLDGRLTVHPRCQHLISALLSYMRAYRNGQWIDAPVDPQHPHEDLIEALRGGLLDRWPDGRRPDLRLPRVPASRFF